MNYYLNRNGHHMGVFPLEELHRRRVAGELTGAEIVWCEGMVQWQSIDVVLQQKLPGALRLTRPTPPPFPAKPKSNTFLYIVVGVAALFFVFILVMLGILVAKKGHRLNETLAERILIGKGNATSESAVDIASKPVSWDSNTLTAAEVMVTDREFRERQYVEGYKLRGERDTGVDDLALGLVQNWIAFNYGGTVDTNLPSLVELSDKLAADPRCTDPLVLTVAAVNSVELREKERRLERALRGYLKSNHLGYPKFFATVSMADNLVQLGGETGRIPRLDALALQRLGEAMADGSIQPADQTRLGDILLNTYAKDFFSRNSQSVIVLVQAHGKDFKWLELVLEGQLEINKAWQARGSGYANTVTDQGWQGFSDHLAKAADHLKEAWRLQPGQPIAPTLMMTVAMGNNSLPDMRLWFDRTLAAQVDYEPAWSSLRWGLRPRWYGNNDAMLALGITALNTGHFETDVPRKFFDSLNDLEAEMDLPAGTHIYARDDIWPHLKEMYEGYINLPNENASSREGWRCTYATVAYLAGKYDVAREQLQALNWPPGAWNLSGWKADLTLMTLEVAARTGAQSRAVTAAEDSRNSGNLASALKQYQELAAITDLDGRTRSFVQERLATLELEKHLQTHEWVDYLPTDTNFTGWYVERGHCTLNADGSLDAQSGENGHLLYSRARLGPNFEVRGQFEVQRSSSKSFQGGLVMGLPQFDTYEWYGFRLKRNQAEGNVVAFARHWSKQQLLASVELDTFTNTFYLKFQNGKVSATVNGQDVFKELDPPRDISVNTNEFLLGLGAFNDSNDTVIRYRNIQARSLAGMEAFQLTPSAGK